MNKGLRKAIRTMVQLIVSGGLTALVAAVANLDAATSAVVLGGWQVVVTFCQNALESSGRIPELLPPRGGGGA